MSAPTCRRAAAAWDDNATDAEDYVGSASPVPQLVEYEVSYFKNWSTVSVYRARVVVNGS